MLERRETHKHLHSLLPLVPSLSGPLSGRSRGRKSPSLLAAAAIVLMEHNFKHMVFPQFPGVPSPQDSTSFLCMTQWAASVPIPSPSWSGTQLCPYPNKANPTSYSNPSKTDIAEDFGEDYIIHYTEKKTFNSSLDTSLATCCLISLSSCFAHEEQFNTLLVISQPHRQEHCWEAVVG